MFWDGGCGGDGGGFFGLRKWEEVSVETRLS